MGSFNRVVLLGNVTRDPQIKYVAGGMAVTELGLAVNDRRKNAAGEWIEEATFVDITLWARNAEIACEYLGKGSQVMIEGRLKLDQWESEGQKRSKLRVVGERIVMVGAPRGGGGGGQGAGGSQGGGYNRNRTAPRAEADAPPSDFADYSDAPPPEATSGPASRGGSGQGDDIPF